MASQSRALDFDPERLVIAGASAGGGLAAGTALRARDQRGPTLAAQVLIYPMLDDRDQTISSYQFAYASQLWVDGGDCVAAGVAYLASDDASFVTGSERYIDGGYMARSGLPIT